MEAQKTLVYAIYKDEEHAGRAVSELVDREFAATSIVVLMRAGEPDSAVRELPVRTKTLVGPGILIGAALGVVGGALIAVGGGFLAAGPLVALLQGAAGGGAAGTLAGTVGGLGYWHDVIEFPETDLDAGAILVGVDINRQGQPSAAWHALKQAGAQEVHVRPVAQAAREVRQA